MILHFEIEVWLRDDKKKTSDEKQSKRQTFCVMEKLTRHFYGYCVKLVIAQ